VSGKLVSLFDHPEFVRRTQARAERELAQQVVPVIDLGRGHFRCGRCSLDFDADANPVTELDSSAGTRRLHPCPDCDPPELDGIEAFLAEVLRET
jgi:hypothetical protein